MRFGSRFSQLNAIAFAFSVIASRVPFSRADAHAAVQVAHQLEDVGPPHIVKFTSRIQSGVSLRYVNNSGICETTPGVHTMSGYVDVGAEMSMWFWFFAARNASETAPFTLWLNGGPGCSSMIGLFQENGPCTVNADGNSTMLNPYSWNNVSNMIYIDQPIGTGFSYGVDPVNSTYTAAPFVWKAFQILFESPEFAQYQSRDFILATESYGGHYGPEFVTYFNEQNDAIASGQLQGEPVVVKALMINNGWIDPLIQNEAYITFSMNAPGYGPLLDRSTINLMQTLWNLPGGCMSQSRACYKAGNSSVSNQVCSNADIICYALSGLAFGDRDPYDLRQSGYVSFPPEYYLEYLATASVVQAIGATSEYSECSNQDFEVTGDGARTLLPELANLANSGLKILIWAGDADIICNWVGVHEAIRAMDWYGRKRLRKMPLTDITLDGRAIAAVQNVDNFSFARVFRAGHEVPAFQPAASLEIFSQILNGEQLHSV